MASPDPYELLARFTPPGDPLSSGDDPVADDLLARILTTTPESDAVVTRLDPTRRRRRHRVIVPLVAIGVLGAGGAAAAAALLAARRSDHPLQATCQSGPPPVEVAVVVVLDGATDPAVRCSDAWTDGTLGTGGPPPLVSCVDQRGMIAVVPGDTVETCTAAGWVPFDLTPDSEAASMAAVNDEVATLTLADPDRCIPLDEARTLFRRVLDNHGLDDWTLTDTGAVYDPINRCASISFDRATRTAFLPSGPPLDE